MKLDTGLLDHYMVPIICIAFFTVSLTIYVSVIQFSFHRKEKLLLKNKFKKESFKFDANYDIYRYRYTKGQLYINEESLYDLSYKDIKKIVEGTTK